MQKLILKSMILMMTLMDIFSWQMHLKATQYEELISKVSLLMGK